MALRIYHIAGYGGGGYYPLWVARYWAKNKDQYILITNPEHLPTEEGTLGFYGVASSHEVPGVNFASVRYNLFQAFRYNDRPGSICWTEFYFETSSAWPLPDEVRLYVNDTILNEYTLSPLFDFYDSFGNYGAFWIGYNFEWDEIKSTVKPTSDDD